MPTKTTTYGRNLTLKINNVQIDNLVSNGLDQSADSRETTTKDSADEEESRQTIRRRTISFSAYAAQSSTTGGFQTLQSAYDAGTIFSWKLNTGIGGDRNWSGSGFLTSLNFQAGLADNLEVNGTIKVTGVTTFGTD